MRATAEQQAVIEARLANAGHLIVEAGAGSGKTTVLNMAASATPIGERGLYVAFNKATQVEAAAKFPRAVQCRTVHSLAFGTHGRLYRHKLDWPNQSMAEIARALQIDPVKVSAANAHEPDVFLQPEVIARLAKLTVESFCRSAEFEMDTRHVHYWPTADRGEQSGMILATARHMWADLCDENGGSIKFTHDHYRKMWQLSEPKLRFDYIMLDEAQDTPPVVQQVIRSQAHAQQILVGDSCQQLYAWAGAVDALANWGDDVARLYLTQSWRFGQDVADEANKWLAELDAGFRLTGAPGKDTTVGDVDEPDAILCRTNVGSFSEVLNQLAIGRKVALVGGGKALAAMARAARDLMNGKGTRHPELSAFRTWDEVRAYTREEGSDPSLKALVRLVDEYGPDAVDQTMKRLSDERDADVAVSTAHKAKGREWAGVRVAGDFPVPEDGDVIVKADANLAYVSVTRATARLERGPLSFIDSYAARRG
jgi:hypothetical protein